MEPARPPARHVQPATHAAGCQAVGMGEEGRGSGKEGTDYVRGEGVWEGEWRELRGRE